MGYHNREIRKGDMGFSSKIREEYEELVDAEDQGNPVMAILELSDIIGAIEQYIKLHHPSIALEDLVTMARATQSAFRDGERK